MVETDRQDRAGGVDGVGMGDGGWGCLRSEEGGAGVTRVVGGRAMALGAPFAPVHDHDLTWYWEYSPRSYGFW